MAQPSIRGPTWNFQADGVHCGRQSRSLRLPVSRRDTKPESYTYTINNTGTSFNRVKKLRILMNTALVESISGITSSLGGSVVCDWVSPYITVDYSALGTYFAPGTDTLSFTLVHKIPGINNPETPMAVTLEADNNNGKSWIAGSEDSRLDGQICPARSQPLAQIEPGEF